MELKQEIPRFLTHGTTSLGYESLKNHGIKSFNKGMQFWGYEDSISNIHSAIGFAVKRAVFNKERQIFQYGKPVVLVIDSSKELVITRANTASNIFYVYGNLDSKNHILIRIVNPFIERESYSAQVDSLERKAFKARDLNDFLI